jgi:hypothetical protein
LSLPISEAVSRLASTLVAIFSLLDVSSISGLTASRCSLDYREPMSYFAGRT